MTAVAPEPTEQPTGSDANRMLYWIVGGVALLLVIVGLFTYSSNQASAEAQELAAQLTQSLEEAGFTAPDEDIIVRTLGNDGGAICENPANALGRATLLDSLGNGASHVGRRAVIVDRRVLQGELLILQTYCPDEVQEFRDRFDDLKFDNTIKD